MRLAAFLILVAGLVVAAPPLHVTVAPTHLASFGSIVIPEWLAGAIAGAIVASIFYAGWDLYRERRQRIERDAALLRSAKEDVSANLEAVSYNLDLLSGSAAAAANKMVVLTPITVLNDGFLSYFSAYLPETLLKDAVLLSKIYEISRRSKNINHLIRIRENHIVHNQAFSSFSQHLQKYDESLVILHNEIAAPLKELHKKL